MNLASITLCVASQRVFIVVSEYFVIESVRKLLDTTSYCLINELRNISNPFRLLFKIVNVTD